MMGLLYIRGPASRTMPATDANGFSIFFLIFFLSIFYLGQSNSEQLGNI